MSINLKNSDNTLTFCNIIGSSGDTLQSNSGIITLTGSTSSFPCYFKTGRLVPLILNSNNANLTCNIFYNNNFHIQTNVAITNISINSLIVGQSGHIIINNTSSNTHNITWQVDGSNTSYIKWKGGLSPTLSSTSGHIDIISYYVLSSTCILMAPATGFY